MQGSAPAQHGGSPQKRAMESAGAARRRHPGKRCVERDEGQSTLQPWAGGAVVSAPILVSGGQRFESSPVHFFSLLSERRCSKGEWPSQRKGNSGGSGKESLSAAKCRVPAPLRAEYRRGVLARREGEAVPAKKKELSKRVGIY